MSKKYVRTAKKNWAVFLVMLHFNAVTVGNCFANDVLMALGLCESAQAAEVKQS